MKKTTYNIVELFSGIGSQAKALCNIGINIKTLGTCEWDIHAMVAYDAIHNGTDVIAEVKHLTKEELLKILSTFTLSNNGKEAMKYIVLQTCKVEVLRRIYSAIKRSNNFVDVSGLSGEQLPKNIDILTYSFPCQDLSNVGAFHGYNKGIDKDSGSRSSLLWQVGRILTEIKQCKKVLPRFLLLENVPALVAKRHFENFRTWQQDLEELGYKNKYFFLNASDFGLPQNRPRLFMISVFVGQDGELQNKVQDFFKLTDNDSIVNEYKSSKFYCEKKVENLLRTDYNKKNLYDEAVECTPNDTISRRAIWNENPQIILLGNKINSAIPTIRTITTKQDRNPNSGNLYFDSHIEGKSKFRYLTPRECFLFMGFTDEDFENVIENNPSPRKGNVLFPRDKLIRMAGNSIPVKLLEGVFLQIMKIDDIIQKNILRGI